MTELATPLPVHSPAPATPAVLRTPAFPGPDPVATPHAEVTPAPLWRRLATAVVDSHRAAVPF